MNACSEFYTNDIVGCVDARCPRQQISIDAGRPLLRLAADMHSYRNVRLPIAQRAQSLRCLVLSSKKLANGRG